MSDGVRDRPRSRRRAEPGNDVPDVNLDRPRADVDEALRRWPELPAFRPVRGQGDERCTLRSDGAGRLDREAGLPHTDRTGQRDEADIGPLQRRRQRPDVVLTPDQWCQRRRHGAGFGLRLAAIDADRLLGPAGSVVKAMATSSSSSRRAGHRYRSNSSHVLMSQHLGLQTSDKLTTSTRLTESIPKRLMCSDC
jgi:hypothetical protein